MVGVNRLAQSTSPYLQQHRDNPVDWWEWSEEALAEAKRRDVPILLSVGYAACHWCHVMAHESFEDAEVAAFANRHFVAIKVDREERPDIDAVYMEATVGLTGHGGWPMTCFLTPSGEPFYAGTYFPKPNFLQLMGAIAQAWHERKDEVLASGTQITQAIAANAVSPEPSGLPDGDDLATAVTLLARQFDAARGGFGGAPKFPPSMVLEFLLREYERTGDQHALTMAEGTLEAMARGGLYDQLAGGFARYSVDADWVVPHFEKMLYDNAQLLRVYLHWWRLTGSELALRISRETAEFLVRDLGTAEGGIASALDADTDGVEGLTYVWTPSQLKDVLGDERAARAAALFEVTDGGTFESGGTPSSEGVAAGGGSSTLQLLHDPGDWAEYEAVRALLLAARSTRPQPARDDKVVTAWNGLAVAALAEAGVLLEEPRYLAAAVGVAELVTGVHLVAGRLRRASRDGVVGEALAVAEDYGDLAEGLLAVHQATADPRWLSTAGDLLDFAVAHMADGSGGFFDTGDDAERLVRRPQDPSDNAAPSGSSALINALVTYSALTGSTMHRAVAEQALAMVSGLATRQPRFLGWGLVAAQALVAGPVQVAVVGDERELTRTAWQHRPPGAVIVSGAPDQVGIPLLADRPLVQGKPAAYVCRGFVCDLPVTEPDALLDRLRGA